MQNSSGYGIILIIVVAVLSLVAGLVVVVATSSESIRLVSLRQGSADPLTSTASPTPLAPLTTSEAPTVTVTPEAQTATVQPTPRVAATNTPVPSETPTVTATASGTPVPTLAPDAIALGRIVTINNSTARLRSAAGLDGKVISAVQAGEYVQVLGGVTTADEIDWLPVRINSGLNGWISADLVETLSTATPE